MGCVMFGVVRISNLGDGKSEMDVFQRNVGPEYLDRKGDEHRARVVCRDSAKGWGISAHLTYRR